MARARMIKPEFFTDKKVTGLNVWARLLFAGIWTMADRRGRLKDKPKTIEGDIFPDDKVNVERFLRDLVAAGLIVRYEVDGELYIQIVHFEKHQYPHTREAESKYPPVPSMVQSPVLSPVNEGAEPGAYTDNTNTDYGLRITESTERAPPGAPTDVEPLPFEPVTERRSHRRTLEQLEAELPALTDEFADLNVAVEHEKFRNWLKAKHKTFTDYVAAFRNWLLNERKYRDERAKANGGTARSQPAAPVDSPFAYLGA